MADQQSFRQEWKVVADLINHDISNAITKSMIYGWNLVTAATPVDTGRARGSWLLTVNVLNYEVLDYVKPQRTKDGEKVQIYPDPKLPETPSFNIDDDSALFLSNAVNYIEFLEYGTDKIPAFGMVNVAAPKIANHLNRQLNKLNRKGYDA